MTRSVVLGLAAFLGMSAAASADPTLINFDDLTVGTTLANQYAGLGVTFTPNAFSGGGGPTGNWATNTDMTIVSATGSDVGGLGLPSLVSGNLLRSFQRWLAENGDPSFAIHFAGGVTSVSLDFAGISTPAETRIFAYDGGLLLGSQSAGAVGQQTLTFAASHITRLVVTPGSFFDWVGVDNLRFEAAPVPEPGTWALLGVGFAGLAARRRRKKSPSR